MTARRALLVAAILSASLLAGCADDEPGATGASNEPVKTGSTGAGGAPITTSPSPVIDRPKGTSDRWHFHDYWKGSPTITLMEMDVVLQPNVGEDGRPAFGALIELPHGVVVPPETGFLTFNATWPPDAPGTINLTYRPADSVDYHFGGDIANGMGHQLNTTESNCDVPHRQQSAWRFNLTAQPNPNAPGVPPREFHLVVTATIGRPLFIDPPHLNWWRNGDIIPLVEAGQGAIRSARAADTNLTLPGGVPSGAPTATPTPQSLQKSHRVPVDSGKIVPEGTTSIVVMLNWTSQVPDAKLRLEYNESNLPSGGPLEILSDGAAARVFAISVRAPQTDTTYSNRTTWEFRVIPEGEPAAAFDGTFTLVAWATRMSAADALAAIAAPAS